jgi:multidrug resistance protein MdtO
LVGLFAMWLVFDQIWGTSASLEMKRKFISILRLLAQFAREPLSRDPRVAAARNHSLRETINNSFDQVRALADGVLLEFGRSRQQDLALRGRIVRWQPQLRMLFLTRIALWRYRVGFPGFELPKSIATAQQEFDNHLATALDGMADRMEGKSSAEDRNFESAVESLDQAIRTSNSGKAHELITTQYAAFFSLTQRIESLALSLEAEMQQEMRIGESNPRISAGRPQPIGGAP